MQCKDIPDIPILKLLAEQPETWHTWYDTTYMRTVRPAIPAGIPEKLVLAKMRMLMRRGLVHGCGCGCRGDFVITEKGKAFIDR